MKFTSLCFLALISMIMIFSANLCAQTTQNEEPHGPRITKDLVAAKWTSGDETYNFDKNGNCLITVDHRECPGTWELRGRMLIINPKKLMYKDGDPCSKSKALQVISVSANDLHLFDKTAKKEYHLAKQK